MNTIYVVIVMMLVGAVIGGVTNHLAIKMLFRPHHPVYILGKRVPFTPGLIPKRRQELANQMGKMVVEHLLTAEGIKRKFLQAQFKEQLVSWGESQVSKLVSTEKNVAQLLQTFQIDDATEFVNSRLSSFLHMKYEGYIEENKHKTLQEILPSDLRQQATEAIPTLAQFVIDKGITYFESQEGKQRLGKMIDDFLTDKGMLGNMIGMFLGNNSLKDKVQPEVIKFLKNKETKQLISVLLQNEWAKIQQLTIDEADEKWSIKQKGSDIVTKLVDVLQIEELISAPLSVYLKPREQAIKDLVPKIFELATNFLVTHLDSMLKKLKLEDVVREQVESFAVERLEEMVLSISRREFKMITYLGALLGGVIGGFQSFLLIWI
ncbi:uncharacterized membrane protein YheB (UPF0754 family) [Metabacillus malikii]|uniref:Uncharacterized membrane protein YheB (UPF0754 family) n=1 Tax=Metabacillus malikii TaxID=1504265 RepID=A0ABT9ZJ75_9BACI|nr:DUF445 family protein [Metabacillus malikii]MDQ0232331.1 uncharacterized membrane protein YheB (UPF0754 family) [Metabacillus malikii]